MSLAAPISNPRDAYDDVDRWLERGQQRLAAKAGSKGSHTASLFRPFCWSMLVATPARSSHTYSRSLIIIFTNSYVQLRYKEDKIQQFINPYQGKVKMLFGWFMLVVQPAHSAHT